MRLARARDYSRWVAEKASEWTFQIERLAFEDIPALGSGELTLSSPVALLAGPNGVGKTTLLKAVWSAVAAPEGPLKGPSAMKLSAGKITVDYRQDGSQRSVTATFAAGQVNGGAGDAIEVVHLDSADAVRQQQTEFCEFQDLEDLINGVGVRLATEVELLEINYLARRDYREVKVYEVEASDGVLPFFEVSYGNDRYDSRTMGAGELAILYLWWAIDRAADKSLILVEEPETYLSPASQEAFCHFLLVSSFHKKINFLVTTHSAKVISSVPTASQNYLYRAAGSIRVVEGLPPPALLETMGIKATVDTFLLVEDEAGGSFLKLTLERYDAALSRRAEIKDCGGHGKIKSKLKEVGGTFSAIKIIGVLDGDMRGEELGPVAPFAAFLPGDQPIEVVFRNLVTQNVDEFQQAIGSADVAAILFGLQGADHHDWYAGLCKQLGLTKSQLFPTIFRMWIEREGNGEAAQTLVRDLYARIDPLKSS